MSTENQQQRPQNCGTGHCSCIECLFEQPAQHIDPETRTKDGLKYSPNYVAGYNDGLQAAQQQQEPVAYIRKDQLQKAAQSPMLCEVTPEPRQDRIGLHTSPPASKPLTDEQIGMAFRKAFPVGGVVFTNGATEFARAIEAAHGIKGDE